MIRAAIISSIARMKLDEENNKGAEELI